MAHTFATHLGQSDLNTALFAYYAAMFESLVFTAQAFVVFYWPKYPGAKQSVAFRLEGTIVNRLWLFDLAKRP